MIEAPAKAIDANVTARVFELVEAEEDSVFNYLDTSSSRANIEAVVDKLKQLKIGIIGVGGTGSYVLDLVSKTPVRQIEVLMEIDSST
jgi:tRNA A37 threonylcarbamoyladenosine dehydratase